MTKHLVDHEKPVQEASVTHILRIDRANPDSFWKVLWKRASSNGSSNRGVMEYVRIERGREV